MNKPKFGLAGLAAICSKFEMDRESILEIIDALDHLSAREWIIEHNYGESLRRKNVQIVVKIKVKNMPRKQMP